MRKLIALIVLASFGLGGVAQADNTTRKVPKDQRGDVVHPYYGGYKHTFINWAGERIVCQGRCLLAQLYMGTGANAAAVIIRDTSSTDVNGKQALPAWRFHTLDSEAQKPKLSSPMVMSNGIVAQIGGHTAGEGITILYLDSL